jgi:hypothetical protein
MAVQVNSIRVGNYLRLCNSKSTEVKLDGIAPDGKEYVCAYNGLSTPASSLEGINLNSDLLYCCGFMELADNDFVIPTLPQVVFRLKSNSVGIIVNDVEIKNVYFLHELQNIVFVLSGKELTFTKE